MSKDVHSTEYFDIIFPDGWLLDELCELRYLKERFRLSCERYATFTRKIRRYRIAYGSHKPKYTYEEYKHSLTIVLVKDRPLRTSLRSLPARYAFSSGLRGSISTSQKRVSAIRMYIQFFLFSFLYFVSSEIFSRSPGLS